MPVRVGQCTTCTAAHDGPECFPQSSPGTPVSVDDISSKGRTMGSLYIYLVRDMGWKSVNTQSLMSKRVNCGHIACPQSQRSPDQSNPCLSLCATALTHPASGRRRVSSPSPRPNELWLSPFPRCRASGVCGVSALCLRSRREEQDPAITQAAAECCWEI